MKMKPFYTRIQFIISIVILSFVLVCGTILYLNFNKNMNLHKYLIIDEIVYFDNKEFQAQSVNLTAINLGRQIGITDEDQQVFEILNQNSNEWICIRHDGLETVYKESNVPFLIVEKFNTDKIVEHDETQLSGQQITIVDMSIIAKVLSYIKDENIVNDSDLHSNIVKLNLYSEKYPGLCFILYYLHDIDSGNCFIYDPNLETTWAIGHELMEY